MFISINFVMIYCTFFLDKEKAKKRSKAERALWRAVILQAFVDCLTKSKRAEDKLARYSARSWLLDMCQYFKMVCYIAGYNPYTIRRQAKRFIKNGLQLSDLIKKDRVAI